jgi:NAD(P)-dependent dehydrogenase (short-subunit alcohol dehydrogenase family)
LLWFLGPFKEVQMNFADKTVVVTGGSRGIGLVIAQAFAAHGADVVVGARDADALDEAVKRLSQHGSARGVPTDATQADSVENLLGEALSIRDRVDVLVNNVGLFTEAPIAELDAEGVWKSIDANLVPTLVATRLVGAQMSAQGDGSVVNISSLSGHGADGNSAAYSAAKAAVLAFTKATALEFGPHGVRCNSVSPGYVETPALEAYPAEFKRWLREDFERAPMGRIVTAEDVANVCLFLGSDYASALTGIDLKVDRGVSATLYMGSSAPSYVSD